MRLKITNEMIDAAAMAIHSKFANRSGRARPWASIPNDLRWEYRSEAKAALEAALNLLP